jgi:neutral ceramidase
MRKVSLFLILAFSLPWAQALAFVLPAPGKGAAGWQAGVARVVITPKQAMWMAGFGNRTRPAEGTRQELWAKALALEDAAGNKAVLVTTDLLGLPKGVSDHIRGRLQAKFGLAQAQVLLNSSHTHSAPVLEQALSDIYPLDEAEKQKVIEYSARLEDQLVELVGKALKSMEPVELYARNGVTRFQVNRRNNRESALLQQTELKGPNDYAVPVIKVVDAKGRLKAIAFGYSCHPTVLNDYQWSGDYPGYAQAELEKEHPGVTALFFQSAGADQNPLPRGSVALARQYGRELAVAVNRVLEEEMRPLPAVVKTAYTEIALPLQHPPAEEVLVKMANEGEVAYYKRWAARLLAETRQGKPVLTSYPYPLQVWTLGDQVMMGLGGELVVQYAIRLKQMFGPNIYVLGYSNDVMSYIPSDRILQEGGYEGATSQMVYGLPSTWAPGIEDHILAEMKKLAAQIGVEQAEPNALKE